MVLLILGEIDYLLLGFLLPEGITTHIHKPILIEMTSTTSKGNLETSVGWNVLSPSET